jgi:hypothetical protein
VQILGLIIIGIVIGVLARLVLPGRQRIGAGRGGPRDSLGSRGY